uniref:Capsid protein n=1 Tax=Feral pigeon astrovirus TaxID=928291 RepID=F6IA14_9VIRU|nr:capsid protein precursor [Feral pigeon astrovirus]
MAGGAAAPMGAKPKQPQQSQAKKNKPKQKQKPRTKPPAQLKKEVKHVERQVKVLKKKVDGPKVDDTMRTTVTVGTITGQSQAGLARQVRVPLNPLLLKFTEGATSTPLSIRTSMYELWRCTYMEVKATPLTGYSNVAGSVGFIVLTLNGLDANVDGIDSLKARRHIQLPLGRPAILKLRARELEGPRAGWWLVDTSQSAADAYGPAIDLFVCYRTLNLLSTTGTSTTVYDGPLWQIEMRTVYQFSTYNPKPGLQTLVAASLPGETVMVSSGGEGGSLVMTVTSARLRALLTPRAESGQTSGKSQTIWAVAGAAVDAAATVLGPWGWLLKGGFWLVRKIFGGSSNDTKYQIYPSLEAAQADQPIYGQTGTASTTIPIVHISEVMNPNPESNDISTPGVGSTRPQLPFRPSTQPTPVYDTSNDQGVAKSSVGAFLFGNYDWRVKRQDGMWIGPDYDNKSVWGWIAYAKLDAKIVQFVGSNDNLYGPGGAVGTGPTWANALRTVWPATDWRPTEGTFLTETVHLPDEVKNYFGLQGQVLTYKGAALGAPLLQTAGHDQPQNQLNTLAWVFIGREGGAGVVVSNNLNTQGPSNLGFLRAPIVIQPRNLTTWIASGMNTTPRTTEETGADDDEFSLCDEDEPDWRVRFEASSKSEPRELELEELRKLREELQHLRKGGL